MEKRHSKVYTSLALSKGRKEAKPSYSKADMIRRTNHRHRRFTHETFLFNSKQIILKKWVRCIFFRKVEIKLIIEDVEILNRF